MRVVVPNKVLNFLFITFFAFIVSACGGGGSSPSQSTSTSTSTTVEVTPVQEESVPASRSLQQIVISPFIDSVAKGSAVHFTTTGVYDDQTSADLTTQVIWTVDDQTLASIDSSGNVTPLNAGVIKVIAEVEGLQAEQTLTIKDVDLDSIEIIPQQASIASGMQQGFQAIGHYSDGGYQDLSQQVAWSSSNTQVAEVSGSTVNGLAEGSAQISATFNGVHGQANLSVNSALLQHIELSLDKSEVSAGLSTAYSVQGFYSDQSIHDLTAQAALQVDDTSIAAVDSTNATINSLQPGTTLVTAQVSGYQSQLSLQVNDAVLTRIEVTPSALTLAAGFRQAFKATGIYSNQVAQDLTHQVTWGSSVPQVANVDNRSQARGEVTSLAKGSSVISAYFDGKSALAKLTVSDAVLTNVEVSPANISLANGLQQQYAATALYSDGSQKDITSQVQWSSDNQNASLSASQHAGLFQTNNPGTARIIASFDNVQGYTNLEITNATLNSLSMVIDSKLALGTAQQAYVYGQYSDGSTQDVSAQVSWSSSDKSIAQVSNANGRKGQVSALTLGSITLSAQLGAITQTHSVEVTAAVLEEIQLSASLDDLYVNQRRTLSALGVYSDGSQQNLNQLVQWASSDDQIITVSNASDSTGLLTALSSGSAAVYASFAGVTSNALQLQVIDNPDYPASISLIASPNVILNDGADSTTLHATLKPLQSQGVIADGTQVDFVITEDGVSRIETALTQNGEASIELTSLYKGFIEVTAEIAATDMNATAYIYSTDNFARSLQVLPLSKVVMINNNTEFQQGSVFALYIRNLSNRDFNLLAFLTQNGGQNLAGSPVTDPAYLNGGVLAGGTYTGMGYVLDENTINNTISAGYVLSDTVTQKYFGFSVNFSTP
jgi:trimeric autotransporter adhesin